MIEQTRASIRALQLAQQIANIVVSSDVPREDWGAVVEFLKAIIVRDGEASVEDGRPQSPETDVDRN